MFEFQLCNKNARICPPAGLKPKLTQNPRPECCFDKTTRLDSLVSVSGFVCFHNFQRESQVEMIIFPFAVQHRRQRFYGDDVAFEFIAIAAVSLTVSLLKSSLVGECL